MTKRIADLFLRARHWQIFAWLAGAYAAGAIASVISGLAVTNAAEVSWRFVLLQEAFFFPSVLSALCWLWSMGSFLSSVLESELRPRAGLLRFAFLYMIIYLFAAAPLLVSDKPSALDLVIPLSLFFFVCYFYVLNFVAKCLVMAVQGRPLFLGEHSKYVLLLFLEPIGIWVIQPQINRLYAQHQRDQLATD